MADTELVKKLAEVRAGHGSGPGTIGGWIREHFDELLRQKETKRGLTYEEMAAVARGLGMVNGKGKEPISGGVARKWFLKILREKRAAC